MSGNGDGQSTGIKFPKKPDSVICLFMDEIFSCSMNLFEYYNIQDFNKRLNKDPKYMEFLPSTNYSSRRYNVYGIKDNSKNHTNSMLEKVIAYVLCHEVFHAYQDYHVGLLNANLINIEAEAEFIALKYVRRVIRDYDLAALLCDNTYRNNSSVYSDSLRIYGPVFDRKTYLNFVQNYTADQNAAIHNAYGW